MNREYKNLIFLFIAQVVGWELLEGIGIRVDSPALIHLFIAIAYAPLVILAYKIGHNPKMGCLVRFISSVACGGIIVAWCITLVLMIMNKI